VVSINAPQYIRLDGKGTFSHLNSSFESTFILLRNPWWTGILAGDDDSISILRSFCLQSSAWRLSGALNDGRHVNAESLTLTGTSRGAYSYEFSAPMGVRLGTQLDDHPIQSHFPLVGYFEGPFTLNHHEWEITTESSDQLENAKIISNRWRLPTEGMLMKLVGPGANTEEHLKMARAIMTLASLAAGTGVSSHRHIFNWGKGELEVWRCMTGDERGPGPVVPSLEMTKYLQATLVNFEGLTPEKRSALRLAIDYINLSANGYLDTRLFHIIQPWEFLARTWQQEGKLSKEVQCLRSRLKRIIKEWRLNHIDIDPHGFWGSRVLSVFDWPKLKDEIEQLARRFGLNLNLLGLDLDKLKLARDNVAHSGKLSENLSGDEKEHALNLLTQGRRCLQLLLLRMLGYDGRVHKVTGEWLSDESMDQALKGKY
jgi:hypothetical protein